MPPPPHSTHPHKLSHMLMCSLFGESEKASAANLEAWQIMFQRLCLFVYVCLSAHCRGVVFQVPRSQSGQLPPITFSSDMFMQWDRCWEGRRGNNKWQVEYNQGPERVTLLVYHTVISLFDMFISLHVPIFFTIKSTENIPLNCLIVW